MSSKRKMLRKVQLGILPSNSLSEAALGITTAPEETITATPVATVIETTPAAETVVEDFRAAHPTLQKTTKKTSTRRPTAKKTTKTKKSK